jgi:hypothetical protein
MPTEKQLESCPLLKNNIEEKKQTILLNIQVLDLLSLTFCFKLRTLLLKEKIVHILEIKIKRPSINMCKIYPKVKQIRLKKSKKSENKSNKKTINSKYLLSFIFYLEK